MNESTHDKTLKRKEFIRDSFQKGMTFVLGFLAAVGLRKAQNSNTVWQIDPEKCIHCENCSTKCVVEPSAVKCVQDYPICGYCQLCFGYFQPNANELTSAAENQICPTDAIERLFIEDPYWEYNIREDVCIGCAKCVHLCEVFGNASFYLQVRHDVCVNCNDCSIARHCPADAFERVSKDKPYLLKT